MFEKMTNFEINILESIQKITGNNILDKAVEYVSMLGEVYLFMVIAILFYWLFNKKGAYKFVTAFLFSTAITGVLKVVIKRPRPFNHASNRIHSVGAPTEGYSFPSGHSQAAAVNTFGTWKLTKNKLVRVLLILNIIIIPLSRLYLAQHYITDVLAGLILGIIMVFLIYFIFDKIKNEEYFGLILSMFIIGAVFALIFTENFSKEMFQAAGAYVAFSIGYFLEKKLVKYEVKEIWWKQIIKLVIGLAGVLLIKEGVKLLLPYTDVATDHINYYLDLIRYFLIGLWATIGAMGIFKLLFGRKKETSKDLNRGKTVYQQYKKEHKRLG